MRVEEEGEREGWGWRGIGSGRGGVEEDWEREGWGGGWGEGVVRGG